MRQSGDHGARLGRDVLLVTAIKLAALAIIYVLFFRAAPAPFDAGQHIAGPLSSSSER